MVLWFGNFITTLYTLILMLNASLQLRFMFSLWCNVFCYLLWLLMIVCIYSRTQAEANKTATYIHEIWNQHSQKKDLNEELRHLQLIACRFLNTKLIFNAKNFFRLDETFFHVIITAVVTYLIILIQFRT
ncbi:putative gustatory receptor 28a [Zophobas morio]|uniref:putative gustatory receptor 28a n=1 Tax=Zophobas morio TaxID=2755281 RepID=UPI0030829C31